MLALTSCNDDFGKEHGNKPIPAPGEDVEFSCLLGDASSRTIYADQSTNDETWRINWLDGDEINVYTPQGPTSFKLAPYKVVNKTANEAGVEMPDNSLNYAKELVKVNATGVRWGTEATQDFYAVYPLTSYDSQTSSSPQISGDQGNVTMLANISANQVNSAPFFTTAATDNSKANVFVKGDMQNNIMWAHTSVDNGTDPVDLKFNAITTVVQFKFNGLYDNTGGPIPMRIQDVTLTAPKGTKIAGKMEVTFGDSGKPTYTLVDGTSESITVIPQYNNVYMEMAAGGTATVNMFIAVPSDKGYDLTGWTVSVGTGKGRFSKILSKKDAKDDTVLKPGSINLVSLPQFSTNSDWDYDLAAWMKDIPDNVYWTELSLPGSWYSASSDDSDKYQDCNISEQFSKGIRAFYLETRVSMNAIASISAATARDILNAMEADKSSASQWIYSYVGISGTGENQDFAVHKDIRGYKDATNISGTIKTLINQVKSTPSEFVILTLSYSDGGKSGCQSTWRCRWLEKIKYCINNLGTGGSGSSKFNYKDYIYTGNLDSNTTINDLRGKLVIKINIDDPSEIDYGGKGITVQDIDFYHEVPQTIFSEIPALFSYTSYKWSEIVSSEKPATGLTSNLAWKSKPSIPAEIIIPDDKGFWCSYTVANRTLTDDNMHPSLKDRKDAIASLVQQSSNLYNRSNHNLYFMIGAGGTRAKDSESTAEENGPTTVANNLNPYLIEQIQAKLDANQPSPLGCVYYNFVGSETGQQLTKTLIEMNNKFYLKRK